MLKWLLVVRYALLIFYMSILDNDEQRNLFEERYDKYYPDCLRFANKILSNSNLAEDAVHEAFLGIIDKRDKYLALPINDFRNLILTMTRYKAIDILRKETKVKTDPINDELFVSISDDEQEVEELVLKRISIEEMGKYIEQIDETSKQILYMRYLHNMSYKEIGENLNMAIKTVEVRIARAKKKVRDLIRKEGDML